jgi:hypothetical protein
MNIRFIKDLSVRILLPSLGGTTYFLLAHYIFGDSKLKAITYGFVPAGVAIVILVYHYLWNAEWKRRKNID